MNARVCYSIELKYVTLFYIPESPYHRKHAKNRIKNAQTIGHDQRLERTGHLALSSFAGQTHWGKPRQRTWTARYRDTPEEQQPRLLCRSLHFSRRESLRTVFQMLFPRSRGQFHTRLLSKVPKETSSLTPPCKQRTSRSLWPVKNSKLTLHTHGKKKKKRKWPKDHFKAYI